MSSQVLWETDKSHPRQRLSAAMSSSVAEAYELRKSGMIITPPGLCSSLSGSSTLMRLSWAAGSPWGSHHLFAQAIIALAYTIGPLLLPVIYLLIGHPLNTSPTSPKKNVAFRFILCSLMLSDNCPSELAYLPSS